MHSDPQDTTPQMTRLLVILAISCLRVLSILSIQPHYCNTISEHPAGIELEQFCRCLNTRAKS